VHDLDEFEPLVAEVDRCVDIVDDVAHADGGHLIPGAANPLWPETDRQRF
jgi:hypothetical protein